jgi:hypothetical protein
LIKLTFCLAALMQYEFVVLMNLTVSKGDLNGIMIWPTTGLFLGVCIVYTSENMKRNKNNVLHLAARYFIAGQ